MFVGKKVEMLDPKSDRDGWHLPVEGPKFPLEKHGLLIYIMMESFEACRL